MTILTPAKKQVKIRLYGIDTPESRQAFGKKAKQFTSSLAYGKQVKAKVYDTDKYGRTVAVIFADGINVNAELIRNGYAWQYRKYCKASFCTDWLKKEENARDDGIGLWYDKNPVPPWQWRKGTRKATDETGSKGSTTATGLYHGNIKSQVLHASGCRHYNCKNCIQGFDSVAEAKKTGYRTHKQCIDD